MSIYHINSLIDLPGVHVTSMQKETDTIFCEGKPNTHVQACPTCRSDASVIRRGTAYYRTIRHLPAFGCPVFLQLPAIRLSCEGCHTSYVWQYEAVAPKKRYTKAFEQQASSVVGSTVHHMARVLDIPETTLSRMFFRWMDQESDRIQKECQEEAHTRSLLVLGMDDFAIRKGHTYNTGLHDLRGGSFLDIIPGRTMQELEQYYEQHPEWGELQPTAVVLDLARGYHRFIQKVYPEAIRIADRYHVNRYVTHALQLVRKEVQKNLAPHAKKQLKKYQRLLGKRQDSLTEAETKKLALLLSYSSFLSQTYEWKEAFIDWYDYSASYPFAKEGFQRWMNQGAQIGSRAVNACLKTMRNWREEICNYHRLRFTNAAVEGKNNKIKALQRRHYFTRNPKGYKQRILLECNATRICN